MTLVAVAFAAGASVDAGIGNTQILEAGVLAAAAKSV